MGRRADRRAAELRAAVRIAVVVCVIAGGCDDSVVTLERIAPTYYEDVTPILARHCWCCHEESGPAHALTALAEVEEEIDAIVGDIDARTMPPAAAASGRSCGESWLPQGLSEEERRVLGAWIDGGRPPGFADAAAPVPAACAAPESEVRRVEIHHTPNAEQQEARCFALGDDEQTLGAFITGLQARASSLVVRNVLLASVAGAPSFSDEGQGIECNDLPEIGTILGAWSADAGGFVLPAGVGEPVTGYLWARITTDPRFAPGGADVTTTLEIGVRDSVDSEVSWATASPPIFELPPGTGEMQAEGHAWLSMDRHLLGVSAIASNLATRVSFLVGHDGQETCVAEIDPWPPAGTGSWLLSTALPVAAGDMLTVRCRYDASDRPETVPGLDLPDDEVCNGTFLLAP